MTSRSCATSGQTNTLASRYNQRLKWGKCVFSCEISYHAFGLHIIVEAVNVKTWFRIASREVWLPGRLAQWKGVLGGKTSIHNCYFVYTSQWNISKKKRKEKDKWRLQLTWHVGSVSGLLPVAVWGGVGRSWWRVVLCCQGILSTGRQPDAKK